MTIDLGSPLAVLGAVFVALKLTGVIGWSWWWVLAPFWAPLGAVALICVGFVVLAFVLTRTP